MGQARSYEDLVSDALAAPFRGWDFSYLKGRVRDAVIPWSYEDLASGEISGSTRLLDIDTGGGETLARVWGLLGSGQRPAQVVATESWLPNVAIARERLEPLGIAVRQSTAGQPLPADDAAFDLVLNRHGACHPAELRRILAPGGVYLTQAVGRNNDVELNRTLGAPDPPYGETLEDTTRALEHHGFEVARAEEAFVEFGFRDIGAVVFHLMAVSWQIPGFDVETYDRPLRELDARIRDEGSFVVRHHRFMVRAVRL